MPPEALSNRELDDELLIAAAPPGRLRYDRYQALVRELRRRRGTKRPVGG